MHNGGEGRNNRKRAEEYPESCVTKRADKKYFLEASCDWQSKNRRDANDAQM